MSRKSEAANTDRSTVTEVQINTRKQSLRSADGQIRPALKSDTNTESDYKSTEAGSSAHQGEMPSPVVTKPSPKSKAASKASKRSRASAAVSAKKAVLMAETAALEEKEQIEQQMLALQQRAKRLELKTKMEKLQAEQEVLAEAASEEAESEEEAKSSDNEQEKMQRVQTWVDAQEVAGGKKEPQPDVHQATHPNSL